MVFIALPALQRSQRDTARKNDVSIVASAITSYQGNNRGSSPSTTALLTPYVQGLSQNSGGSSPSLSLITVTADGTAINSTQGTIFVYINGTCANDATGKPIINKAAGSGKAAVATILEGSSNIPYCQDV